MSERPEEKEDVRLIGMPKVRDCYVDFDEIEDGMVLTEAELLFKLDLYEGP